MPHTATSVVQLSESDAVDALRLPFYSSRHARGSHLQGNQFDLGNTMLERLSCSVQAEGRFRLEAKVRGLYDGAKAAIKSVKIIS